RIDIGHPGAVVPDDHRAAAILALGDGAFPGEIIERMIFGLHREALDARHHADALGNGPALEHAVELQSQIEMQPARIMALHGEAPRFPARDLRVRLRRLAEVALLAIGLETPWRSLGRRLLAGRRHSVRARLPYI